MLLDRNDLLFSNVTTLSTTNTHQLSTSITTPTADNDDEDIKNTLSYAIPLTCLAIILVLGIIIGIRHRHRVLDKWISLKQMRNTNPKFRRELGIRRDSEFESYIQDDERPDTTKNESIQEYSLTIF